MKKILFTLLLLFPLSTTGAQQPSLKRLISFYSAPQAAPNFYFYDMMENQVHLSDFEGKLLLVHVWKKTCAICIYELPKLAELANILSRPDFEMIIIHSGQETPFEIKKFLNKRNITLRNSYFDKNSRFSKVIGANSLPVTMIIDGHGRELAREYGAIDWDSPVIRKQVLKAITDYAVE